MCLDAVGWLKEVKPENMKKAIALEYVPRLDNKQDAKYLYAFLDGKDIERVFDTDVRKKLQKESRYRELYEWMKS